MGVKGSSVGSIKNLRKSLKKNSGGFLKRIPAEGIMVRFMTEPDQFFEYKEHYNETDKFFPCGDECPACEQGDTKGSMRYLANVVDVTESRVEALVLPKSLVTDLMRKYDKYGTLMDRTYELSREGTTQNDTRYSVDNEGRSAFNMRRYEPLDLEERLTAQLPGRADDDDEDDEVDDEPKRPKVRKAVPGGSKHRTVRRAAAKKPPAKKTPAKTLKRR